MEELKKRMAKIEDSRHSGYIKHKLEDMLIMILCGVLCGIDHLEELHVYIASRKEYWKERLGIEKIPSRATLGRVLSMIDGKAVGNVVLEILREHLGTTGKVVAVDGKAICSTSKDGKSHSALQILTAYITETHVILGQETIHEKTNEIPVFQEMLEYLELEGKTVTADAMHCQTETCRKIRKRKGNYVLGVKDNQPSLHEDISTYCRDKNLRKGMEYWKTEEKNKGRIETRICWKIKDISWLESREKWPGLQSAFCIERIIQTNKKESRETSYYITSLDASAEQLMWIVREHWKVESMHWMLDVTFSEDDCRFLSENAHKTLNAMRKCALAVHRRFLTEKGLHSSIKSNMLACLLNPSLFSSLLEFL